MDTYNIHILSSFGIDIRTRRTGKTGPPGIIVNYNKNTGHFSIWNVSSNIMFISHQFNNSKNADFVIELIEGANYQFNNGLCILIEQICIADFKEWLYE